MKLVLGVAMSMFLCVSIASSHEGYCEKGLYIPTHIIECVTFCADRGKVYTTTSSGELGAVNRCECTDGEVKYIPGDPQSLECPKPECGPECLRG